jgi:hypothetical protein
MSVGTPSGAAHALPFPSIDRSRPAGGHTIRLPPQPRRERRATRAPREGTSRGRDIERNEPSQSGAEPRPAPRRVLRLPRRLRGLLPALRHRSGDVRAPLRRHREPRLARAGAGGRSGRRLARVLGCAEAEGGAPRGRRLPRAVSPFVARAPRALARVLLAAIRLALASRLPGIRDRCVIRVARIRALRARARGGAAGRPLRPELLERALRRPAGGGAAPADPAAHVPHRRSAGGVRRAGDQAAHHPACRLDLRVGRPRGGPPRAALRRPARPDLRHSSARGHRRLPADAAPGGTSGGRAPARAPLDSLSRAPSGRREAGARDHPRVRGRRARGA